jgi:hypothetical protein
MALAQEANLLIQRALANLQSVQDGKWAANAYSHSEARASRMNMQAWEANNVC